MFKKNKEVKPATLDDIERDLRNGLDHLGVVFAVCAIAAFVCIFAIAIFAR